MTLPAASCEPQNHTVYMVQCANGSLYTGYTTNVHRRVALHNAGKGARYTRSHRPVLLLVSWSFLTKSDALRAERAIKHLPRTQKLRLIDSMQTRLPEILLRLHCSQVTFYQSQDTTRPPPGPQAGL